MTLRVGYIGLGIMGLAMTKNLLKAGCQVVVWNRTKEKLHEAISLGALPVDSPSAVAAQTEIVFICVTDAAAVRSVLFEGPGSLVKAENGARIVVNMSTIAPSAERDIASALDNFGISYLDAPVTGGDVGARDGTLTIMAGGDEDTFHRVLPVFELMGKSIAHTGPQGTGQLTKCVNQILVALNVISITEALAFLERTPLEVKKTLDVLGSGAAASWALNNYGPRVIKGDLQPGFRAGDMLKDIKIVLSEAKAMHLQMPGMELMKELFEALCAVQKESLGIHALIRLYR